MYAIHDIYPWATRFLQNVFVIITWHVTLFHYRELIAQTRQKARYDSLDWTYPARKQMNEEKLTAYFQSIKFRILILNIFLYVLHIFYIFFYILYFIFFSIIHVTWYILFWMNFWSAIYDTTKSHAKMFITRSYAAMSLVTILVTSTLTHEEISRPWAVVKTSLTPAGKTRKRSAFV